jgi:hypothetical protein
VPQPTHTRSVAGVTPSHCWQKITRWRGVVISHSAAKRHAPGGIVSLFVEDHLATIQDLDAAKA